MKGRERDQADAVAGGYSLLTIGATFALTLTGFALLGLWLDRRLGTVPLLTLLGTFLGMGVGGYWGYLRLRSVVGGDHDGGG